MKRLDVLEAKRERDAEWAGEKYVSWFTGKFNISGSNQSIDKNELRWSVYKHKPAVEMLLQVQMKVFPFLKDLTPNPSSNGDEGNSSFPNTWQTLFLLCQKPVCWFRPSTL